MLPVSGRLLLPRAFLVAVRLEALAAFVFRHLQTSFLLKISHGVREWFNRETCGLSPSL